jgi:hypothetical protein
MRKWKVIERQECISQDEREIPYSYIIYERRKGRRAL